MGRRTLYIRVLVCFRVRNVNHISTPVSLRFSADSNHDVAEQTIPIPQSRAGVEQLIEELEDDRQTVEETSIEKLEAEIDQTVYDLFELTEDEREVIEDYLEVF